MVSDISGSYTNVVGLPLAEVVDVLLGLGAIALPPQHSARENQVSDLSP
jgi:hypothetical protein